MNRRNIIIIISILIIGALFGGAYWYFTKKVAGPVTPSGVFPGESGKAPRGVRTGGVEGEPEFVPGAGNVPPRLYELHKTPVAGVGFAEAGNWPFHSVSTRYVERALGYVFETPLSTYVESRIVNETRPRIYEALWGNNGKSVVLRSIDDKSGAVIKTQILNLGVPAVSFAQSTSTGNADTFLKTETIFLPDYIPFMATSEEGADLLFYLESGFGAAVGSVSDFKNSNTSSVFNSAFTEWLPQFPNQNLVTLTTRPSASVPGYLFFINKKTNSTTKIVGGINGLTTLTSHDGRFVLYSETVGNAPELSLYDTAQKSSSALHLQSLPEKCAWGNRNSSLIYCAIPHNLPPGDYPDQWYQGVVSFSDTLWEIDANTLITKKIMSPEDLGYSSLDIINPTLSSDDTYLVFMSKITGTPWVYRVVENIPLQAPAPTPIAVAATTTATATKTTAPQSVISPNMKKLK